jgi:hypothetical protein
LRLQGIQSLSFPKNFIRHDLISMCTVDIPGTPEEIRKALDEHGLPYRTIQPLGNSSRVRVFDKGSQLGKVLQRVARRYNTGLEVRRGRGEFFPESSESRQHARTQYEDYIREYEQANPGARRYRPPGEGRHGGRAGDWDWDWTSRYRRPDFGRTALGVILERYAGRPSD